MDTLESNLEQILSRTESQINSSTALDFIQKAARTFVKAVSSDEYTQLSYFFSRNICDNIKNIDSYGYYNTNLLPGTEIIALDHIDIHPQRAKDKHIIVLISFWVLRPDPKFWMRQSWTIEVKDAKILANCPVCHAPNTNHGFNCEYCNNLWPEGGSLRVVKMEST